MKIMTMDQYLKNPSGPYSSSFARRDLIIANLEDRFAKLLKERKKDFKIIIFRGSNPNEYYFYLKIPSEKFKEVVYDVVIQFIPVDINCLSGKTINKYAINIFSNSLNFTFTYAYWYNQDELIIKSLKDKISKQALTQKPEIKNAEGIYGFEKSLYFALLYIKYNNLNQKYTINSFLSKDITITKIKPKIKNSNSKIIEYNMAKKKLKEEQKEKNKKNKNNQKEIKKFEF